MNHATRWQCRQCGGSTRWRRCQAGGSRGNDRYGGGRDGSRDGGECSPRRHPGGEERSDHHQQRHTRDATRSPLRHSRVASCGLGRTPSPRLSSCTLSSTGRQRERAALDISWSKNFTRNPAFYTGTGRPFACGRTEPQKKKLVVARQHNVCVCIHFADRTISRTISRSQVSERAVITAVITPHPSILHPLRSSSSED